MFAFIGFLVMVVGCFFFFCGGLFWMWLGMGFGCKTTTLWGLVLVGASCFGFYKVYDNSPYGVYVKSEQVQNDKENTQVTVPNK